MLEPPTVFPVTLHWIQLSRRKQTWHHICVRFYFLDSKSSIIDKYAFKCFSKAVFSLDLNRKIKKINVYDEWYMKWIIYELRIWNQVKLWSSQLWTQFLQLRREAWKIQDFNGVWTRDLAIFRCDAVTNWAMKPLTLGAGHLWVLMVPWGMNQWWKWYMKWIIYELRIWNQVKLWSSQLWT